MENSQIISDNLLQRNESDFICAEIDNELLLMSLQADDMIGLNATAAQVWKLLEQPHHFSQIVQHLVSSYEVEKTQCEEDIRDWLEGMVNANILCVVQK